MKTPFHLMSITLLAAGVAHASDNANRFYPVNRPPLQQTAYVALPLGAVKPSGWLKSQLTLQADGLTGHLDEFWPSLTNSAWKGMDGDHWERGPYYLDGLVPLAYQLNDARLKGIAQRYLDFILASGQPNGWFGPAKNKDRWPLAVALKVLTQYEEATGDPRVVPLLKGYFNYLKNSPPDWPDKEWRGVRAMENVLTAFWLYNRTGDAEVLKVAQSIFDNSFDWPGYFMNFAFEEPQRRPQFKPGHPTHVVNIAMAIKHPGVWYQQTGDNRCRLASYAGIANLDFFHGQVGGRFGGDEHLSGREPTQGTELCAIVEYMFSLEKLVEVMGDVALADRLEMLAYNCKPATCTPDYWAHQYDQQANQVLVSRAKRRWTTNGDDSNLYGLEPNFGCCTANMHQGWPKFVTHLWMATHDQGLAAIAYGPCEVRAKAGDGTDVVITEKTDYPFDGEIELTVKPSKAVEFPLHLRIPSWAEGTTVKAGGRQTGAKAGEVVVLRRTWRPGDRVVLTLPMKLWTQSRWNNAVSILRGPLCFSLRVGEDFRRLKSYHDKLPVADWEIRPTTPWNYGLVLDRQNPEKSIKVKTRKIGPKPFANETAPVVLTVKGRALPQWTMADNSAGPTPPSPAISSEKETRLELIPYGSTRLRITEFPVITAEK